MRIPCTYFVTLGNVLNGKPFPHDLAQGNRFPAQHARAAPRDGRGRDRDRGPRLHPRRPGPSDRPAAASPRNRRSRQDDSKRSSADPVRYFAFPFGQHANLSPGAFQLAREAGYEAVCSAYGGYNFPGDDPFHLQRIHVDDDMIRLKNRATVDPRKTRTPRSSTPRPTTHHARPRASLVASPRRRPMPREHEKDGPLSEMTSNPSQPQGPTALRTDTLADSVLILLALTGVQRLVGFGRAMLFCRWLDAEQLGQWDMAFGFLHAGRAAGRAGPVQLLPPLRGALSPTAQLCDAPASGLPWPAAGMAAVAAASIHLAQRVVLAA